MKKKISNVVFTGKYNSEQEKYYYEDSSFINILLGKSLNSRTLMPNRFYNSLLYYKPMIALNGSWLSKSYFRI